MAGEGTMVIEQPRSAWELVGATLALYRRFPLLFLTFAAVVVVPYEVIVLIITGTGPLHTHHSFLTGMLLQAIDAFLVTALISALHVHAVDDVRDGRRPILTSVFRRSLVALPVVTAAAIITWLGITVGFFLLVVPGILLMVRWSVAVQAAALQKKSWIDALRRSAELSRHQFGHVFWLLILVGLISGAPALLLGLAYGHSPTTVGLFIGGTALQVLLRSFTALATALLYFDLSARLAVDPAAPRQAPKPLPLPGKDPLHPGSWSDEDRPAAWYIDPADPGRMRYWAADGTHTWSGRTTKTPKQVRLGWEAKADIDPEAWSEEERPAGWYVDPSRPRQMRYWPADGSLRWSQQVKGTPRPTLLRWEREREGQDERL